MTVAGAFLVSLSFRSWPLDLGHRKAALHTLMTVVTVCVISLYPNGLLHYSHGAGYFDSLIYVPLVTLVLSYGLGWALLAALPTAAMSLLLSPAGSLGGTGPVIAIVGTLLVSATQKRHLNILHFSDREALFRLPLILLPITLPMLLTSGWRAGLVPALLLVALNLTGFLTGMMVLRSRFRLLAASARLARQALTDPLTGLWNRRQLEQDLGALPVGGHVLVIDLDYFKTINDRFGHDVGDEYLTSAAGALNRALAEAQLGEAVFQEQSRRAGGPAMDGPVAGGPVSVQTSALPGSRAWLSDWASSSSWRTVRNRPRSHTSGRSRGGGHSHSNSQAYRMGGEEFALLTPAVLPEGVSQLAELAMQQVRELRHRANPGGQITCSVGVAQRLEGESASQTLRRADAALLQAKANGRDRQEYARTSPGTPSTGLRAETSRPAQPLLWEAIHTSLSLAALDRDLTTDDWTRLLQAAILSVPTAELGSINVREGHEFVLCAQIGFDDNLLHLRHTEGEQLTWYGLGLDSWKRGQPRAIYGTDISEHSDSDSAAEELVPEAVRLHAFRTFGRIDDIRATLCIPVVMDGEVVGHLNLDRMSDGRRFDGEDLRVARAFADQVTVLTVAARRRVALERAQREQEWLLEFSLSLFSLPDAHSVARRLLSELESRHGCVGELVLDAPPAPSVLGASLLGVPAPASAPPDPARSAHPAAAQPRGHIQEAVYLPLFGWPDRPHAHMVMRRGLSFSAHEERQMTQAARAASRAVTSVQRRNSPAG